MAWNNKAKIKHLLTEESDHASVQASMNGIFDVLAANVAFSGFKHLRKFKNIPAGDDIMSPDDYANRLLEWMYDYADENRIWID